MSSCWILSHIIFFASILCVTVGSTYSSSALPERICHDLSSITSTSSCSESLPQENPQLPINGGATELPAPTSALKFVTVGHGVQNYSCASTGSTPVAVGALATLYDFSRLARENETALHGVPPTIVYQPLSDNHSGMHIDHYRCFPVIGNHYFAADGTPIFNLSAKGDVLFAKKIASVDAPANANIGPAGTGAVPWLELSDKGGSIGVTEVYRVVTAGGKAPTMCGNKRLITVPYAAEYWFFA